MPQAFPIFAVAMTGAEVTFVLPADTAEWAIHADGGDIELRETAASAAFWKILSGTKESFQARTWQGTTLILKGVALTTARIIVLKGLLS